MLSTLNAFGGISILLLSELFPMQMIPMNRCGRKEEEMQLAFVEDAFTKFYQALDAIS